ncbi:MAG TPA: single-stranded DNA-binding protein [Candidatus Nitrosotalea sp.]|nr:single-stranded DNA-binding protein [Candidatus Nitrosotalea sp.]
MVNKVILIGRLTSDPELRSTSAGTSVANLRLATNTFGGKDAAGNRREHTEFVTLVVFGRQAENSVRHLKRGRMVYADGRLQTRSWADGTGQRRQTTEVVVDRLQYLSPPAQGAAEPSAEMAEMGSGVRS